MAEKSNICTHSGCIVENGYYKFICKLGYNILYSYNDKKQLHIECHRPTTIVMPCKHYIKATLLTSEEIKKELEKLK